MRMLLELSMKWIKKILEVVARASPAAIATGVLTLVVLTLEVSHSNYTSELNRKLERLTTSLTAHMQIELRQQDYFATVERQAMELQIGQLKKEVENNRHTLEGYNRYIRNLNVRERMLLDLTSTDVVRVEKFIEVLRLNSGRSGKDE